MDTKKLVYIPFAVSLAAVPVLLLLYHWTAFPLLYSLTITSGTICYHFGIRLAVGGLVLALFHNQMDSSRKWFQEKPFEKRLYKRLGVRKWKKHIPTFTPETFRLNRESVDALIQATCQAEIVHEINMLLSFVPIFFSYWVGDGWVFVITSCMACLFDGIFVVVQRYNRPRLRKIAKR